MSDFWLYLKLGLEHVLDLSAYDHILFLIVLCAAYSFALWKRLLLLVTLFTAGHTISLLLAHYMVVSVSGTYIEFLIPITILVTAVYNIVTAGKPAGTRKNTLFYVVTLFFGLIHGFGFARYYAMIGDGDGVLPLLEFALGVELAQVIVVLLTLFAAFIIQAILRFNRRDWVLVVSSIVVGMVLPMLVSNWPF